MSMKQLSLLLSVALAFGVGPASAASASPYQSAFSDYKRFDDAKPRNWKQVNADVARAPGHDHAKMPAPAPAPVNAVAKPDPHAAHKHH